MTVESSLQIIKSQIAKAVDYVSVVEFESIVEAIKRDHDDLKKYISILKGDETYSTKKAAFKPFTELLKSHSKSEEKVVYQLCLRFPDLREDTYEGYVEHGLADRMMKESVRIRDKDRWKAQVKVLAELVEHHIEEEESEFLPKLKKYIDAEERKEMADDFIRLRQRSLPDHSSNNAGVLV